MERRAVKFQHRIATGHSTLDKPFEVESKHPLDDSKTVKTTYRQHKAVPTALVVDDALILASYPAGEGEEPRVTLLYCNGGSMNGADWQNAVSVEHDVPHLESEGAEESERFYFEDDLSGAIAALEATRQENQSLRTQLAATTEGKDETLQALADENAVIPGGAPSSVVTETKNYSDGSSATGPAPLPNLSPDQQAAQQAAPAPAPQPASGDTVIAALEAAAASDASASAPAQPKAAETATGETESQGSD
jgi:hypothetical protein